MNWLDASPSNIHTIFKIQSLCCIYVPSRKFKANPSLYICNVGELYTLNILDNFLRKKIDIFFDILVPKLFYDLRKKLFNFVNDMVESAYHIKDVAIKKGDIVLSKDKGGNGNGKDKNKPWNKNMYVVNDGVVDTLKAKEPMFHLSNAIYVAKQ